MKFSIISNLEFVLHGWAPSFMFQFILQSSFHNHIRTIFLLNRAFAMMERVNKKSLKVLVIFYSKNSEYLMRFLKAQIFQKSSRTLKNFETPNVNHA